MLKNKIWVVIVLAMLLVMTLIVVASIIPAGRYEFITAVAGTMTDNDPVAYAVQNKWIKDAEAWNNNDPIDRRTAALVAARAAGLKREKLKMDLKDFKPHCCCDFMVAAAINHGLVDVKYQKAELDKKLSRLEMAIMVGKIRRVVAGK